MVTRTIGIDVSKWDWYVDKNQPPDYAFLAGEGVDFTIIKAVDGYLQDKRFAGHYNAITKTEMPVIGFYAWNYPWLDGKIQAQKMIEAGVGKKFDFYMVDVEQGTRNGIRLAANQINDTARQTVEYLAANGGKPLVIYSGKWFLEGFIGNNIFGIPLYRWMLDYPLNLAEYPYPKGVVSCTWQALREKYLPEIYSKRESPRLISGMKTWQFWQWSGDKFRLPGCPSLIDLNYYNGSLEDMKTWIETGTGPAVPVQDQVQSWQGLVTAYPYLNIRDVPKGRDLGDYFPGEKVLIMEESEGWGRTKDGWICLQWVKRL